MGFFKDVKKLQQQGKEISKGYDPVAQMKAASASMQQMTQQTDLLATGIPATATVNELRDTGMEVNLQPITEVDVTVFPADGAPFPATARTQGHGVIAGLAPGTQVQVRYDPTNPSVVAIG
ncbi:MAG: DUF3592 domain-containing protein [Actinomycetota bacterium]